MFGSISQAGVLEAKSVADLLTTIEAETLIYKETGKIFGFDSTQSCLFASPGFIVLKNYCFPKRPYPARSYTIISAKFGMIELYQETLSEKVEKHDVRIDTFPEPMRKYVTGPLTETTIADANKIIESLYNQHGPACWSTNYSWADGTPSAQCNVTDVIDLDLWVNETQTLTSDIDAWAKLLNRIEAKIIQ